MLQYPIQTPATARQADIMQNVTMHIVPMFLEGKMSHFEEQRFAPATKLWIHDFVLYRH